MATRIFKSEKEWRAAERKQLKVFRDAVAKGQNKKAEQAVIKLQDIRRSPVQRKGRAKNPTRNQRARRKKARKAIRALLHLPGRKNPIPAFLTGIGPAIAEGTGFAAGELGVSELAKKSGSKKRHTVKKKKSKARGKSKVTKPRRKGKKTKKAKRNPSRRASYVIGVGRRGVDTARTKGEARAKAKLLRMGGARRVRIKQIPKTFR